MVYDLSALGKRIASRREELEFKQYQLANIVNISQTHLSNIENGHKSPSFELLLEICIALQIELEYFANCKVYPDIDEQIIDKIKRCSDEDKIVISQIIDIFLNKNAS